MAGKPAFFVTSGAFRQWLELNHETEPELLVGFWKKSSGKPSINWPQARDQALCFGWIDGVRTSLGEEAYTIRFTPRRKGSIWSRVNVERFAALKGEGLMTSAGELAFGDETARRGVYAYENEMAALGADEEALFRVDQVAWADWDKRPPGYRKMVLHWITSAKRPKTRAKRLTTLIECNAAGEKIPGYDIRRKKAGPGSSPG